MIQCRKEHQLLAIEDAPPFELLNSVSTESPVLIVCDHASNYVPSALNGLGIDPSNFQRHIAYDIGAAAVSRRMSEAMHAPAVLCGFSRLVIDANRYLTVHDSIPSISDGISVVGNESLSNIDRLLRVEELFIPYHCAIGSAVSRILNRYLKPLVMSVHSYTPNFQGFERPWEIGVLWEGDDDVASLLIDYLRDNTSFHVGENEPYHACHPVGYTVKTHAKEKAYPHLLIEIRQDLIADEEGQNRFADILVAGLEQIQQTLGNIIARREAT
jgi:predicted N-formylglutamate amidohydrolase